MSLLVVICIGIGGAAGALARAVTGRLIRSDFPYATLTVNVLGSFILAAAITALPAPEGWMQALLGSGFCGAFTTFSTFILETVILARSSQMRRAVLYVILTIGLCCLASLGGILLLS